MGTEINAVILEEKRELFEDLQSKYSRLLSLIGFDLTAHHATSEKETRKLIQSLNGNERIHLFICDISLSTQDYRGLLVIQNIKRDFPDIFIIGNSSKNVNYRQTTAKSPSFDMYIDKTSLVRAEIPENGATDSAKDAFAYLFAIQDEFLSKFQEAVDIRLDENSIVPLPEFKDGHLNRELTSLVNQVCFSGHNSDNLVKPDLVHLKPLEGGFSGSSVFRLDARNSHSGIDCVPAVLKVSETSKAISEAENFHKYVKWLLPYNWRVELLGVGTTKRIGAVGYSFILSGEFEFDSVTAHIKNGNSAAVERVIDSIFSPALQTWYKGDVCRVEEGISGFYSNRLFPTRDSFSKASDIFFNVAQELTTLSKNGSKSNFKEYGVEVEDPVTVLFGSSFGEYTTCICHGDLNSNNVILSDNGEVIFIDFQSTGRGHCFFDFIVFENSIRVHHPIWDITPGEMMRFEQIISDEDTVRGRKRAPSDLPRMYKDILAVRKAAKSNFENESWRNYIYGTTAFALRLMRIDDFIEEQYGRLVGQVLYGISNLS